MEYKVGQIFEFNHDIEAEKGVLGEKFVIPKGTKVIIGADNLVHCIRNGMVQPLRENVVVNGYDVNGIGEYLYIHLRNYFEIDEMLIDYGDTKEQFIKEIECALDEIGFS